MKTFLPQLKTLKPLLSGRLPGQLVIQYSNLCNADCPQCGMRRSEKIGRHTLKKEYAKQLIDSAAKKGIRSLSFTGGEPLLFLDDIIELTHHATSAGIPYVRTGTNGFIFNNSESPGYRDKIVKIAEKLAATKIYTFWISLDSANPAEHERMRGIHGVVKGMEKALPIFHEHGIYPSVNLGINRATGGSKQVFLHNRSKEQFVEDFQNAFSSFYDCVLNLGFTMVNACYPMSSSSESNSFESNVYGAASTSDVISFTREEKALMFKALYNTIPKYRGKLRIFSPRCSLHGLIGKFTEAKTPLFPCRGGTDFFFVECEKGKIHPCGYREESQQQLPDLESSKKEVSHCDLCEWECFRDPSDVLGPFADIFTQPFKLAGKICKEPQFFRLLIEDLRYYAACNFFNGRMAPEYGSMKRFEVC